MKKSAFLIVVIFIICSCEEEKKSNINNNENTEIVELISNEWNELKGKSSKEMKVGRTANLPKKFSYVKCMRCSPEENKEYYESFEKKKYCFDELSLGGYLKTNLLSEKQYENNIRHQVTKQDYEITISDKGKSILVGETIEDFVFKTCDYKEFEIVKKEEKNDTLIVAYKINGIVEYPTIEVLDEFIREERKTALEIPHIAKFIKGQNGVSLLSVQRW